MRRTTCREMKGLKKGPWTAEEDRKLVDYIQKHGHGKWRTLPKNAELQRCGKSCRLRWTNYLRPDIRRGKFSAEEVETIICLHEILGNKWSAIASRLPGRTDNEIKNYWNTHIRKRLLRMGLDPMTHGPRVDLRDFSPLLGSSLQLSFESQTQPSYSDPSELDIPHQKFHEMPLHLSSSLSSSSSSSSSPTLLAPVRGFQACTVSPIENVDFFYDFPAYQTTLFPESVEQINFSHGHYDVEPVKSALCCPTVGASQSAATCVEWDVADGFYRRNVFMYEIPTGVDDHFHRLTYS